jgi:glucose/arabinose dehydrogenase
MIRILFACSFIHSSVKTRIAVSLAALFAIGTSGFAQTLNDSNLFVQTVVSGLSGPTGMAFSGSNPNDFFVIEKDTGRVKRVLNGSVSVVLDLPVAAGGNTGLLGIALHPNFGQVGMPNNDKVYLYYSRSSSPSFDGSFLENRLSRFSWNGSTLTGESVLSVFASGAGGVEHDGGPILFGGDGKLYGVVGDFARNVAEQNNQSTPNTSSVVGGIYRLNDDGSVPTDNPFFTNSNPAFRKWYAYGVRNSFGLASDPVTGALWDTENGSGSYDEVNRVAPGFNSGWAKIMGPDSRSAANAPADLVVLPGSQYSDPEFSWLAQIVPTSMTFLKNSNFGPGYDDKVLVAGAASGSLYLFTLNGARDGFVLDGGLADLVGDSSAEYNQLRFGQSWGTVTSFTQGPDGYLYAVNLSGKVYRIVAVPEPTIPFIALFAAMFSVLPRQFRAKRSGH